MKPRFFEPVSEWETRIIVIGWIAIVLTAIDFSLALAGLVLGSLDGLLLLPLGLASIAAWFLFCYVCEYGLRWWGWCVDQKIASLKGKD